MLVRSDTEPNLSAVHYKSFKDDPRYKETGKDYGPWPPYPDWQDMPLRKFGAGYGKKCKAGQKQVSHFKSGGLFNQAADENYGAHTQHGDAEMVDGMSRVIGHGRKKFTKSMGADHLVAGCVPKDGKEDFGKHGHSRENDVCDSGLEHFIGHGKHHWFVKDHLNDDSTTEGSSSVASRANRREEGSRRSSEASSRPRSAR